jgi:hypothetical protein
MKGPTVTQTLGGIRRISLATTCDVAAIPTEKGKEGHAGLERAISLSRLQVQGRASWRRLDETWAPPGRRGPPARTGLQRGATLVLTPRLPA